MTLADLKRLALAATPGPWATSPATSSYFGVRTTCGRMLYTSIIRGSQEEAQANAAYIAALSPERVLQLLDVIEAAKAMGNYDRSNMTAVWEAEEAFAAALAALDKDRP